MGTNPRRIILVFSKTGYEFRDFLTAACELGIDAVPASDRCDQLEDPWGDAAIPLRFEDPRAAAARLVVAARQDPVAAIFGVGDAASVIAALASEQLGLPTSSSAAVIAAQNKARGRELCAAADVPIPAFMKIPTAMAPEAVCAGVAERVGFPCVLKPLALSASRGVIRADDPAQLVAARRRLRVLFDDAEIAAMQGDAHDWLLVESFVAGAEVAVEGLLTRGRLQLLAVFDKPAPGLAGKVGPYFAETLYVTPSRLAPKVIAAIESVCGRAVAALGLSHGPIHAELRLSTAGPVLIEMAARSIGGLCSRALRFGAGISLEVLLLRHAIGVDVPWVREPTPAGVAMLPVPAAGIYHGCRGIEDALAVPGIEAVEITAKPGQEVRPLPEGSSYMGFIFARADTPAMVEAALTEASEAIELEITGGLPLMTT